MKTINQPGKFEGEQEYIHYFYDIVMNGCSNETLWDMTDTQYDIIILSDKDKKMCRIAVTALGKIGDAKATDAIIPRLDDDTDYVCRAAAEALGMICDSRAVDALMKSFYSRDNTFRKAAIEAIGNIFNLRN